MNENDFSVQLKVRDYECDMAHGVNNAVYASYLEHARHEHLRSLGVDFAALARRKIGLIVIRSELDYKKSLVSGDEFIVTSSIERASRLRFQFIQKIYRLSDQKLMLEGKIIGTAVDENGRPHMPEEVERFLKDVPSNA